jgi:hypothetical protein
MELGGQMASKNAEIVEMEGVRREVRNEVYYVR